MFDKGCVNHATKVNVNIKCALVANSGNHREAKQLTGRLLRHPLCRNKSGHIRSLLKFMKESDVESLSLSPEDEQKFKTPERVA